MASGSTPSNPLYLFFRKSGYGFMALFVMADLLLVSFAGERAASSFFSSVLTTFVAFVGVAAIGSNRSRLVIGTVLAAILGAAEFYTWSIDAPRDEINLFGQLYFWYFSACAVIDVFSPGDSPRQRLQGAVCLYLIMVVAFGMIYSVIASADPGAFRLPTEDAQFTRADSIYFSFVTQTTLGYGDIVPISRPARSVVAVQATAGVLYLAIVIAAIVSGGRSEATPQAPQES